MVLSSGSPEAFPALSRILAGGGVAVMPCDTIYGLVGAAPAAEARIRSIKGRGEDKPFLLLVAGPSRIAVLSTAEVPPGLARHWPGPLTVILPARGGGTVAVRVPGSAFLRSLVEEVGSPLYSTSVNRAGRPALWKVDEILAEFEGEVDVVIDGGDLPGAAPSTIVDATSSPCRVVRQGALELPEADLL